MRAGIIGLGFVLGIILVYMAHISMKARDEKAQDVVRLDAGIAELKREISGLKLLPQQPGVPLETAYVAFINDMHLIAKAHHLACAMGVEGAGGADIGKNVHPSMFPGLREVRFRGVFSGAARRTDLLSLLDALDALEVSSPVILRSLRYEKDILAFDVTVVGL